MSHPLPDDCAFFLHTVQSHALRCTIEALKDVLLDISMHISTEGLKICTLDYSRTAIVYLKIDADKCESFICPTPLTIGISVSALFKLVKSITVNDLISIYILKSSPEKLRVSIDCRDRCMRIESELNTLDLDDDSICIPKIEFQCILLVPSHEFQKNIRDLSNVAEFVDISAHKGTFSMSASGDFASQKLVFGERINGLTFQTSSDEHITGRFSLKYLNLFAKSASLSGFVELYLRNSIPLILKYSIGSIGRVCAFAIILHHSITNICFAADTICTESQN